MLSVTDSLKKNDDKVYQHQVAKSSRIDRMMTSRVMSSLERKHLISRIKQSNDGRTNLVNLTEKGENTLKKAILAKNAEEKKFFEESPDNAFVEYLQSLLPEC